jgi:uncharacterized repeat protein (TIGR01451 family)
MKAHYLLIVFSALFSTVNAQTLTGITPSSGTAGTTVTAILTGQNTFFMNSSPQGIQQFNLHKGYCRQLYGTNMVTLNNDSVQVDINIPSGYVNDVYDISVWTGSGQSLSLPASFTVTGGVDQNIQTFSPTSVTEDTTFTANITGQNLQSIYGLPGFNLVLMRSNHIIPATSVSVTGTNSLDADFWIPAFADTGNYQCIIQVSGNCFVLPNALHVGGAYPKQLVSVSPASANAGTPLTALVTGQNTFFMSSSPQGQLNIQDVKIENANCNIYHGTTVNAIDDEHLNADFTIPADASNGQYDLTVKYNWGLQYILPNGFTINNGVDRSVNTFSPNTGAAGTTVNAIIDGLGLADIIAHTPTTIQIKSNAGFVISSTTYSMSGNQLTADFTIPVYADNGFYKLEINSGTGCYSLNNVIQISGGTPPAIVSIVPSQGLRGQTLTAVMTGMYTFFTPGTQSGGVYDVNFSHTTSTFNFHLLPPNITQIDSDHVQLNMHIPANAPQGYYNVAVLRVGNNTLYLNPGFEVRGTLVSGNVFFDVDSNGIYNAGDMYLANQEIHTAPDNVTTFTDPLGNYSIGVEPGSDTITVIPDSGWINTSVNSYVLNAGPNDTSGFNFGVRPLTDDFNVLIDQTSNNPRCNQNVNQRITFRNHSTNAVDGTIWYLPDSNLTFVSSTPPPSSTNGDTVFWTFSNIFVQANYIIDYVVHTPGPGTHLRSFACVDASHNGNIVASACDSLIQTVSCSFDPNDKSVEPEGLFASHYVLGADYLKYLIRFQNTGNDTAYDVSVFDTIDATLDLNTFELITNSHPVAIYITRRVIEFRFTNINLPDSIHNEPLSHGFVKYRIKPNAGFVDGTPVNNTASIHFDLNAPVITNTVMSTVMSQIPLSVKQIDGLNQLILYPNPTDGYFRFELPEHSLINGTAMVIDETGRILRRVTVHSGKGEMNLGNYSPGIYTVIVVTEEGMMRSRIVVY